MANRRRIEEVYNDYAKKVIPQDAGAVQRRECRQAFFAGATAMLSILNFAASNPGQEAAIIREVDAELNSFRQSVMSGASAKGDVH